MIAPACYPVTGAEAIVNMKLLQAFAKFDDVTVDLISRSQSSTYPSGEIDSYGIRVRELHVINITPHYNLDTFYKMFVSLVKFKIVFFDSIWAVAALPLIHKLIKKYKYDFVLTKNAPSYLLGAYLQRKGLKWVASWNDPFPPIFYPPPYSTYSKSSDCKISSLDKKIVSIMRKADYHIFPSYMLQEHMRSYLGVSEDICRVIPHCVLADNTIVKREGLYSNDERPRKLRIVHSGNLYGHRNPTTFFNALDNALESNPQMQIEVAIIGGIDEKWKKGMAQYSRLEKIIQIIPPVEYKKSLDLLSDYDLAFIIEAACNPGGAVFLPTKVTDFMQVGIPIMAISPKDGVLHQMYKEGNVGYFADVTDTDSIKEEIIKIYNDFKEDKINNNIIDKHFLPKGVVEAYREIGKMCK